MNDCSLDWCWLRASVGLTCGHHSSTTLRLSLQLPDVSHGSQQRLQAKACEARSTCACCERGHVAPGQRLSSAYAAHISRIKTHGMRTAPGSGGGGSGTDPACQCCCMQVPANEASTRHCSWCGQWCRLPMLQRPAPHMLLLPLAWRAWRPIWKARKMVKCQVCILQATVYSTTTMSLSGSISYTFPALWLAVSEEIMRLRPPSLSILSLAQDDTQDSVYGDKACLVQRCLIG